MGIVKMSIEEVKELQKSIAMRTTNLSTISNEVSAYFASNPKEKTLTYDVSEYVKKVNEADRNAKFRLLSSELQNKTRIKTSRVMHNGAYVLIFDKSKAIEQPKQLVGMIKGKTKGK